MSIFTLYAELYEAKTPEEKDAAHARFQERKLAAPTLGELATNKLRQCMTPDGKPMLASDEHVEFDGQKLVTKKLN